MPRLPNCEHAILDIRKLEDYCLNAEHPRGRHKARLFRELLGITRDDAYWLRDVIIAAVRDGEAIEQASDVFGPRWRVDVPVLRKQESAMVRTVWIVRAKENIPRFVSCWVL